MLDLKLNPSQSEAIAAADAHLTDAGLPGYTELLAQLNLFIDDLASTHRALDAFDAEVARTAMPRGPYPTARWPEGLTHLPAGSAA